MMRKLGQAGSSVVIALVRGYQTLLSPIFSAFGSSCRFEPSCSQYMIDAVRSRGPIEGVARGLWRIARCNPFGSWGYDPAPPPRSPRSPRSPQETRAKLHGFVISDPTSDGAWNLVPPSQKPNADEIVSRETI